MFRSFHLSFVAAVALAFSLVAALPTGPAAAAEFQAGPLSIADPTSRPNLPNRPAVVYLAITNGGDEADRLIGASAPDFDSAELHESVMQGDVMAMRPIPAVDLPPHGTVELARGGLHIMLFGARNLYKPGDMFPVVLSFEKAGAVRVEVMVEPAMAGMEHSGHSSQMPMPATGN